MSDEAFGAFAEPLAAWIAAWNEPDAGALYGRDELAGHITAVHRFMTGLRLEARGTPRRGHDTALADWAIVSTDGKAAMTGTNVVRFAVDGRITDVVGIPDR